MERLSPDDIRTIHEYMLSRYGGLAGEYESGLIDYMEGFAAHQYFCDGNKRTAYMCAKNFLELIQQKQLQIKK